MKIARVSPDGSTAFRHDGSPIAIGDDLPPGERIGVVVPEGRSGFAVWFSGEEGGAERCPAIDGHFYPRAPSGGRTVQIRVPA